ncbi:MAG: hypothetical protein LBI04_11980 [Treponema sp.]|jgi:hypothetical protein|nr:hypothetical protein [Treponema sp.]
MSFITLLALFIVLGAGLGVLFNILVIKNFPEAGRKGSYVKTVITFLFITVIVFAAVFGKFIADDLITSKTNELEKYVIDNYSNLGFVRSGIDVAAVNNDISKLNQTVADLNTILWPKVSDWGLPRFLYDTGIGYVKKELQKKLAIVNTAGKAANSFVDENGRLTASSLISGLRGGILKIVKIIVFVIVTICAIILVVYIIKSLSRASKERKRIRSESAD